MSSNEEEISNNTYTRNRGMNSNYDIISYQKHILHSDNSLITFYQIVIINAYTEYISEDFHSSDNKIRYITRHISADWGINFVEYEDDIRPLWAIKDAVDFLYHS